ncbi:MAG: AzlD domain-containing protein [Ideonella sp.]|nr:AzlD domain-containing protein [Ideonella sp.]MCC7456521.1 AzlD domain-containing protein [Nitrospira sp.]
MNNFELFIVTVGMTAITLLTRSFFMLRRDPWPMPAWLTEGLRYAPLAAMVAVVAPEVVMSHGQLVQTWKDARLFGAAAATAWFFWRRDMLGTIAMGTGVLLALRLGLGW